MAAVPGPTAGGFRPGSPRQVSIVIFPLSRSTRNTNFSSAIEESPNKRTAVGQWVASVRRWMQSSGDDNLISRARALEFLANTLQSLSRKDDTLNADQVKLLVTFFCSLFENDHKAGVIASARALRYLIAMKHFQSSLGSNIIQSICKLGDDFKLQLPSTRLEIYHIFSSILETPAAVSDLEHQHGNTGEFILDLLNLCRNERDPDNLMMWFATLKSFLQDFNPSIDVTSEIFKTFSAYFPISLRPSAMPTAVTTDKLKATLRSCFSAHHRVASLSIPFLVDKLDKVDQTVAVKVDILLTLDACLANYDHPQQSIVPHADQIWGSLKYEVRNGEIQDIIKATLKALCSLTKRLDGENLQSFIENAWRDLKEDLSDLKYPAQAGNLLIAIIGAATPSFALLLPRALEHIKKTIKNNSSVSHKRDLIALMNSILKLRLHLVSELELDQSQSEDKGLLLDDLFGDSLFHDLYLPLWEEHSAPSSPIEYVLILTETMQGLGSLVGQKSSGKDPIRRLCSDSTCEAIFKLLAQPVIISPLKGPKYPDLVDEQVSQDLLEAGEEALINAVPLYPPSFQYLLLQYLVSIKDAYTSQVRLPNLDTHIWNVSSFLCNLNHSGMLTPDACSLNEAALINTFLQGLQWMLSEGAGPKFLVIFINAIRMAFTLALKEETWDSGPELTKESFRDMVHEFAAKGVPQVDLNQLGRIEALDVQESGSNHPRLAYYLFVVQQLYRRFTALTYPLVQVSSTGLSYEFVGATLSKDLDQSKPDLIPSQDILLGQLGQLAASVIRSLNEDEQRALELDSEAFSLFHSLNSDSGQELKIYYGVNPANDFRTAHLVLGIIQGLWPGAIDTEIHLSALSNLVSVLVTRTGSYPPARSKAAMDELLCVLSNKFDVKDNKTLMEQRLETQRFLITRVHHLLEDQLTPDDGSKLRVFRSVVHYLAGDVACPLTDSAQNLLLTMIIDNGPMDSMIGRQFAQSLGLMAAPRECLSDLNHAIRKKLGMGARDRGTRGG
ncbi:hypothetical protein O1611_g4013 [Lasiodiplodia mahajangana]|uniref:Uncharacterized protein n=1 Tax=Lasiodiplodia mahajangana TaxID=1108764 RepID=A0ACC2JQ40_9PEZI|nr:hypothetical protein O1611_g4013 [Lasiodiplodia mahajangana]